MQPILEREIFEQPEIVRAFLEAELLVISDDPQALGEANLALPFSSGLPEWLTPLIAVLPGQCFALQLTLEKGLNPDQPEGLTKVTETY